MRGDLLDISKAFDRVYHKGLLFKSYGVEGALLSLLECYHWDPKQRVVLNDQTSDWRKSSGVPQGTVLGPLFYSWYI